MRKNRAVCAGMARSKRFGCRDGHRAGSELPMIWASGQARRLRARRAGCAVGAHSAGDVSGFGTGATLKIPASGPAQNLRESRAGCAGGAWSGQIERRDRRRARGNLRPVQRAARIVLLGAGSVGLEGEIAPDLRGLSMLAMSGRSAAQACLGALWKGFGWAGWFC